MKKQEYDNRRSYLKYVLAGTVAGAATAAIVRTAQANSAPVSNHLDETLYHESEAFKKYYNTLRS
jgi:hypothetical protein